MKRLTEKQMAFVAAYLKNGGNATEAYRTAYPGTRMNPNALKVQACRALDRPLVQAAIDAHRAKAARRAEITLEDSVDAQTKAMKMAEDSGNVAVYAAAAMNRAKLLGHVTDKAEVKQTVVASPVEVSPDIATLWRKAGLAEPAIGEDEPEPPPVTTH
jgi:phage terminase small subunit